MIEGIEEEKPIITTTHEKIDIDSKKSIWTRVKLAAFHEQREGGRGGGRKFWHGRGSLTGSTTRQWPARMAARGCRGEREREELLEIFSHKGSTYVLGTCEGITSKKYTSRGEG